MVSIINSAAFTATRQPRPIDVQRDLEKIADLIELCFADTLDPDGHSYLRQMRSAARNSRYLHWASIASDKVPLPHTGFVWEEDGQLVGNLTLIPQHNKKQHLALIANVAVHPKYRRRGIARELTLAAIDYVRSIGVNAVWLHVREENEAAYHLYQSIGFTDRACRTTWHNNTQPKIVLAGNQFATYPKNSDKQIIISRRHQEDWPFQKEWLDKLYPADVTWHLPLRKPKLQPGFWIELYQTLMEVQIKHWAAHSHDRLVGILTWQASSNFADHLWLATHPENEDLAAYNLLSSVRQSPTLRRPLALDYPSDRAVEAIKAAGFHPHQTLVWMSIDFNHSMETIEPK
jgi:GNAT superfamily N-acetyltransferase